MDQKNGLGSDKNPTRLSSLSLLQRNNITSRALPPGKHEKTSSLSPFSLLLRNPSLVLFFEISSLLFSSLSILGRSLFF